MRKNAAARRNNAGIMQEQRGNFADMATIYSKTRSAQKATRGMRRHANSVNEY